MRTSIAYIAALAALASGSPLKARQAIDLALIEAAPEPTPVSIPIGVASQVVHYNLAEATAQATAVPLPVGGVSRREEVISVCPEAGEDDTAQKFLDDASIISAASSATTPTGYERTFSNLKASSSAYGYLGFTTLDTYDVDEAARQCNDNYKGCLGFNIYYERDPSVDPSNSCPDPASNKVIKAVYWGGYLEEANAHNQGQWRNQFEVVIAGSNGYMKTSIPYVSPSNDEPGVPWNGVSLGNYAINAPDCNNKNTFMGSKVFTNTIYNPDLCRAACESQNKYNTEHPPPASSGEEVKICKFFVTYLLAKNGDTQGQYCSLYTQPWKFGQKDVQKNDGFWYGSDHYTNQYGFSYVLDSAKDVTCPAAIPVPTLN